MRVLSSLPLGVGAGLVLALALGVGGCQKPAPTADVPNAGEATPKLRSTASTPPEGERRGFARVGANDRGRARIQVNGFAWRAALDTVSFMPLQASDPYGGAISTEWYAPPNAPKERLKVNVLVSGPELRSDSVKVTVFRQVQDSKGRWVDAKVNKNTALDLENVILQRAREMRSNAAVR